MSDQQRSVTAEAMRRPVVVSGDVTLDWNLARRDAGDAEHGGRPEPVARACRQPGGAALLADLVEAALAHRGAESPTPELLAVRLPADPPAPDDGRFPHSYAVWTPRAGRRGERRRVWRSDPAMGLDRARSDDWLRTEWERLARDIPGAAVIALDDAGLGFRDHSDPDVWRGAAASADDPWVLLTSSRPVADGPLWEHLQEHCAERLVVLMTIDDLRGTAVQVSRELSWERTAQDLCWELIHNPRINGLSRCAHVVVSFGAAGAVLLSRPEREGEGPANCSLLFDPEVTEGMWEAERPGAVPGATTCLAAALVRELVLAPGQPDLPRTIGSGLAAGRRLHEEGYGDADDGMDIAFPIDAVADRLREGPGPFEHVPVQDPAAFLPRRRGTAAGREEPPQAEGHWTILEDRYRGDLRGVATDVALHGPRAALQGVPLGRFGKLLTVDRGEIESYRAVRALMAEYCRSPQTKPVSIGVFGAPGSGKSFGTVQVVQSVDPGRISDKIEFNLSQFGTLDDLHDALHQVRDVGLSGAIPLVFWDEFDASFQGEELGWLRYFLAPMQDGAFRQGQILHPIGRAIFVFAGGTSDRMSHFGESVGSEAFRSAKGPDFTSRLKGYVDVLGPNPVGNRPDPHHLIRRAILLRSMLERSAPQLIDGTGLLRIDRGVLRAFLEIGAYRHGARSLEAIIATSRLSGQASYQRSSLPAEAQLDLHVGGREFLALVQRLDLEGATLERMAQAMHEIYCEDLDGHDDGPDASRVAWSDLPEHLRQQNRDAVRDIPEKLRRIDHVMMPARSHDAPQDFPGEDLEQLARYEHERYVEAKIADGWRLGPERDDRAKTSPTLVPWDELSEEEREKDRSQVRGIPRVVARTGYTVVRLSRHGTA